MRQTPESLKTFCRRFARAAVSPDGAEALRLLQLTELVDRSNGQPPESDLATSGRVGIWERKEENGRPYFARRLDRIDEWNFWANLGRIEPKGDKRRIVYLGESVARGYLYDPQYTPAMVLERILSDRLGDDVEVLDLARTNLGPEVRELAIESLQLEPDALVIFSGNNWTITFPQRIEEYPVIDSLLRDQGLEGVQRLIDRQLSANATRLVGDVASRCRERGVPIVWLVPEFNLGDWRDPLTNAPHLPDDANREWIELRLAAEEALAAGDLERAEERAGRMLELDRGLSATSLYLLAECCRRRGDRDGELGHLERARDAPAWDPSRSVAPRTHGASRRTLLCEAARQGDVVIDLPGVFREHLAGEIPDRRLFIDYCHLTGDGIVVAMAAAASGVLRALGGEGVPWRQLVDPALAPDPRLEAEASFLAAIHNAHWWQSAELVGHYCRRAVEHWPGIAEVMTRFIDIQTRTAPMLMCRAAAEIVDLGSPLIQHYLLRYNHQQLDRLLLDAMLDALGPGGAAARSDLDALRRCEHGIGRRPTNLLDYYYNSAALQPQEVRWAGPGSSNGAQGLENEFYKAYWLESRFVFIGEAGLPARFDLTCRLPPHTPAPARVVVSLNGREQVEIEVERAWRRWELPVDGEALVDGINEVALRWPMPDFPGNRELRTLVDDLVAGIYPDCFCAFGEIHHFTVAARPGEAAPAIRAAV